ncbi:MAG: VCBS repeat-containing protein, partial [Planctomycetes bacterium]|nr:VCBS repeat-containing protein [Planctomycetota bacterium]
MLSRRGRRWILFGAIAALSIGILASIALWRASRRAPWYGDQEVLGGVAPSPPPTDAMESRITAFCGNCHAVPLAKSFARDAWHNEVLRGYEFYARSGLAHLEPPPVQATVEYFRSRAPEELVFPVAPEATTPLRAKFTVEKRTSDRHPTVAPAIAYLRWARLETDGRPALLVCDMRDGNVMAVDPNEGAGPPSVFARLNNPCHVEPCDLDGDSAIDLVVADLGSFVPYDHDLGRVVWLRRDERRNTYEEIVLASGLGRVADVRPGDLDGDGDIDLVVADFGLHRTGQVLLLENTANAGSAPEFVPRKIDPRPGAIHVPVVDLDGDGRLDFLGLISQEFECVEAYMNQESDASMQG